MVGKIFKNNGGGITFEDKQCFYKITSLNRERTSFCVKECCNILLDIKRCVKSIYTVNTSVIGRPKRVTYTYRSFPEAPVTRLLSRKKYIPDGRKRLQTCLPQKCPRQSHLSTTETCGVTGCHVRRWPSEKEGLKTTHVAEKLLPWVKDYLF